MGNCNGYNSRCGFVTATRDTKAVEKLNQYASILKQEREVAEPFKGRLKLSDVLINTTIPQIFGGFIDPNNMEACALGAIHLEGGGHRNSCQPDWRMIEDNYDLYHEEIDQRVDCIKCKNNDSLGAMIYHMNDVHEMTNKQIGKWLRKYGL